MTEKAPSDILASLIDIALRHAIPVYESVYTQACRAPWDHTWPLVRSARKDVAPIEVLMLAVWKAMYEQHKSSPETSPYSAVLERFKGNRTLKQVAAELALLVVNSEDHPILDIYTSKKLGTSWYKITDLPVGASRSKDYRDDPQLKAYAARIREIYAAMYRHDAFLDSALKEYHKTNKA